MPAQRFGRGSSVCVFVCVFVIFFVGVCAVP